MFRLCFLLTTITVSLLFSDFCFNYVMRIKGIYWPDRPLDIIKNVLLPKERQVETNKFILILSPETTHPWVCGGRAFFYKKIKGRQDLFILPALFMVKFKVCLHELQACQKCVSLFFLFFFGKYAFLFTLFFLC